MINELKEASLALKLIAFVGIPIAALFACGTVSITVYLALAPTPEPPTPVAQSPTMEVSPVEETSAEPLPATASPEPIATLVPIPTKQAYTPTFVPNPCTFEIQKNVEVECGFVIVPENRNGDLGDTIKIAFAVYRSASNIPASDPVIFLQGGPGSDAVEWSAGVYEEFIAPIVETRDVIIFDQRGAGLSEPGLDCRELTSLYLLDLAQNIPADERATRYNDAFLACRDRLKSEGVNLTAYTTPISAADIKDIITVLGYEQANLYGASYGTRLALTTMRDYPEVVRAAVLDSTLPLEVKLYNQTSATADYTLNVLFENCAANPDCNAAYPNLREVFYDLVEQLDAEPIPVEVTNPINGLPYQTKISDVNFINAVLWGLQSSSYIPIVPKTIYQVHNGDYSFLNAYLALPLATYDTLSLGLKISIDCHEQVFATTPEELEANILAYPNTKALGLSAIYGSGEALFSICETWGTTSFDPRESEPLVSDIPTLIIAGEYDSATPPSYGRQVAENLNNSYFFEFSGLGHTPSISAVESCPLEIALTFLSNPSIRPDNPCFSEVKAPSFVVPFTDASTIEFEPFTNEQYGIAGIVPDGWTDIGLGFYNRANSFIDPTQLGMQADVVSSEKWVEWLTEQFSGQGFDRPPEPAGERETNGLIWRLYATEFAENPVDMALAESNNRTLLVVLVSDRNEHNVMYDAVFLPVMDALVLVE